MPGAVVGRVAALPINSFVGCLLGVGVAGVGGFIGGTVVVGFTGGFIGGTVVVGFTGGFIGGTGVSSIGGIVAAGLELGGLFSLRRCGGAGGLFGGPFGPRPWPPAP